MIAIKNSTSWMLDNFLVEWVHSKWNSILSELVAMNRIVEAARDYDLLSIKQQ